MYGRRCKWKILLQTVFSFIICSACIWFIFHEIPDAPKAISPNKIPLVEDRQASIEIQQAKVSIDNHYLTCDFYHICEEVVVTTNPRHYLNHTLEGEERSGGTLFVDKRKNQGQCALTICGHNTETKDQKFTNIAHIWEQRETNECEATYNDGVDSKTYKLWGAYRIDKTAIDLAYPTLSSQAQLQKYLADISSYEGWNTGHDTSVIGSVLILLTCSEALKDAPHRTLVIFTK